MGGLNQGIGIQGGGSGGGTGTVTSVTGTANRITITGVPTVTPTIDIAATYVGQTSITTLGTITTGVWNGTAIANANLANSSITVNGTSISLGASGTVTAAAGTLTGTTLNSTVVTSSLTSVGTLTSGSLGSGFTTVAVARGGTGVTTFGGSGTLLFTTSADTLSSSANITYNGTSFSLINSDTSTITLRELVSTATNAAVYLNAATPSSSNYAISSNGTTGTNVNAPSGATGLRILTANTLKALFLGTSAAFTPAGATSGAVATFSFTKASTTGLTASTEVPDFDLNFSAASQHAAGVLATQRTVRITATTYNAVSAGAITDAATLGITGAPIAGTTRNITNSHGILISAGAVNGGSTVTNGYGLTVNAPTGATNNFAAQFVGGKTMFPAGTTSYAPINLAPGVAPSSPVDGDVYYINTNDRFMVRKNATDSEIISASTVTTEALVTDTSLTVTFNGTTYKLLARA